MKARQDEEDQIKLKFVKAIEKVTDEVGMVKGQMTHIVSEAATK